jgi:UDP-glucose 4-epimerase
MKILITGGLGYVGGRLSQYLSLKNHDVVLTSRNFAGTPDWLPRSKVVKVNFKNESELNELCKGIDCVIHLAGMSAADCVQDPVAALEVNGVFTGRLLQASMINKVKRFIYLSTAHVYGSPRKDKITEETCPLNIHSYAISHRAGEDLVRLAHSKKEIEGIVVRLSNTFGAPAFKEANCWMLLVNDLCVQSTKNQKLVLNSSGEQKRDFISLSDTERALEHLLLLDSTRVGDGLFNVGGDWSVSVYEMAQLISKRYETLTGKKIEISRREDLMTNTSEHLDYDISKLLSTGFQLEKNREAEIDRTLKFCLANFGTNLGETR